MMTTEEAMRMFEDAEKTFGSNLDIKIASFTLPHVKDTMPDSVKERIAGFNILHTTLLSFAGLVVHVPAADLTLRHMIHYAKIVLRVTDAVRTQLLQAQHDDLEVV